jgi:3-oxoacyl-[acyl-carrier-protein] synthase-3
MAKYGWCRFEAEDWPNKSIFTKIFYRKDRGNFLKLLLHKPDIESIDYFLPHLSSEFFRDQILKSLLLGINIPKDKWFTNLTKVGNVATVSFILMLEELINTHNLQKGQKILIQVPESARFTYGYALLTVCQDL